MLERPPRDVSRLVHGADANVSAGELLGDRRHHLHTARLERLHVLPRDALVPHEGVYGLTQSGALAQSGAQSRS